MFLHLFVSFCGVWYVAAKLSKETLPCDDQDEFRCTNGECIDRYKWCDGLPDCWDSSDENFCHGVPCLDSHFKCKNGACIPKYGVCDTYQDCSDGSDEEGCGIYDTEGYQVLPTEDYQVLRPRARMLTADETKAVAKAAKYFFSKMTDNGWGSFTPRAVVALSFADKASPFTPTEKALIAKQLNVHLSASFIHKDMSLSTLSQYINALYATCQDPRNFRGEDLVHILRSKTNVAMKSNFAYPAALLTLCIADQVERGDLNTLSDLYINSDRTGFKALVIMAMICIGHKTGRMEHNYMDEFLASDRSIQDADIYAKALYLQAAHAAGHSSSVKLNGQLLDGSFGDMLATYVAVPALLGYSLLDLSCNPIRSEGLNVRRPLSTDEGKKVILSLWITSNKGIITTHSTTLTFEGNKTLYDIMLIASDVDPLFSFLCEETDDGKKVYSVAGVPNDIEAETSWVLYDAIAETVTPEYMTKNALGLDKIYPRGTDHFIFWLKRPIKGKRLEN